MVPKGNHPPSPFGLGSPPNLGGEFLEIKPGIECKPSVRYRIVRLISAGGIGSRQFSEVRIIDIQNSRCRRHKCPPRIVHHIDAIDPNLEFPPFGNTDPFHQIHVEIGMRGPFDPLSPERSNRTRRGIGKDDIIVSISESPVAERTLKRL